jgi:hypothetical protein
MPHWRIWGTCPGNFLIERAVHAPAAAGDPIELPNLVKDCDAGDSALAKLLMCFPQFGFGAKAHEKAERASTLSCMFWAASIVSFHHIVAAYLTSL